MLYKCARPANAESKYTERLWKSAGQLSDVSEPYLKSVSFYRFPNYYHGNRYDVISQQRNIHGQV